MGVETLPRLSLANLPTPIEVLERLRQRVGGPKLLIKRDDLSGMAYGGNKLRKLEYLLGQARKEGADTVITSGSLQTNHGRLTAAACAKTGFDFILVVTEEDKGCFEANRILQAFLGAKLVFIEPVEPLPGQSLEKAQMAAGEVKIAELLEVLKAKGKKTYVIPRGGRSLQGTASYCNAMAEIKAQLKAMAQQVDHIVVPTATGSTLTGILLGNLVYDLRAQVLGITVSRSPEESRRMVTEEFNQDATQLGYSYRIDEKQVKVNGDYVGASYGVPTEAGFKAMQIMASTEAIMLDPVYTGKAMAGYLDLVAQGYYNSDETVLFIHTGGGPLLFLDATANQARRLEALNADPMN